MPGMLYMVVISEFRKQRKKDCEFKANLDISKKIKIDLDSN